MVRLSNVFSAFLAVMLIGGIQWAPLASSPASAADFKMGVIDPQTVLEKTKAGRRALDALREYAQAREKLLTQDQEDLKAMEKQLKDQEASLSEAAKKEKQERFRSKIADYQKRLQEFNQELAQKQKGLVDEYMKKIAQSTQAVAEKNGYTLVVDKGSEQTIKIVIYNKDTVDLTDMVIKEFDRVNK
ncbi:outer membrane protein [Nitrospira sp.]|nr:outer membrane protein [Nitrospira sp.]